MSKEKETPQDFQVEQLIDKEKSQNKDYDESNDWKRLEKWRIGRRNFC